MRPTIWRVAVAMLALLLATDRTHSQEPDAGRLPKFGGEMLRMVQPRSGQRVFAGDSMAVVVQVVGDVQLERVSIVFPGGAAFLSAPPFRTTLQIPNEHIGPMTLGALGETTDGDMVSSASVTVEVGVRVALNLISASEKDVTIQGAGDVYWIRVSGHYADGVARHITYQTSYEVVQGESRACVTNRGEIVGRAPGDAVIRVRHGGYEEDIRVTIGTAPRRNNAPDAKLSDRYEGRANEEICISARTSTDLDECLGEALTADSIRWRLDFDTATYEGVGWEFCLVPENPGYGMLELTVTDQHSASSKAYAMVVIE